MTDLRSLSRGVAALLLALLPAYCSMEGFVTGETLVIDRRTNSYSGSAAIITAIAYGLFATALITAAWTYFIVKSKRRTTLVKYAWNVTVVGAVLFFAGRFVWVVQ